MSAKANGTQRPVPSKPTRTRTHAQPHRPQALPAAHHRAAPGKPQQSKAAPRRAGPYEVGVAGLLMSARGTRGLVRPDMAAILPHLPIAVNGLGRTWSFARKSAESESYEVERGAAEEGRYSFGEWI